MASEQKQQIERMIIKVAEKYPTAVECGLLTDIHLRVNQETGEFTAFDDDDNEITRCVVDSWIDNKDEDFYTKVKLSIREAIEVHTKNIDAMGLQKPFSFILEDEEREHIDELYVADDDTVILGDELLKDLDKDLDDFFNKLINS